MSGRPELEYLRPPVRSDGPIFLADPDPAWVGQYALAERRIRAALERRAILIEHVGSTSVPKLVAKPVIDADAKASVVEEIISRAQPDQRRDPA